jgi:4-oxalocrotonate tautomerase family enzyme
VPIIRMSMFEGRDPRIKARLVREISDCVAEITGNDVTDIHVMFDEYPQDSWGRDMILATERSHVTRPNPNRVDFATISDIEIDPNLCEEYFRLRRDVINPGMATREGFVSSLLLQLADSPERFVLVNKWMDREAEADYSSGDVHDDLKDQTERVVLRPLQTRPAYVTHLDDTD